MNVFITHIHRHASGVCCLPDGNVLHCNVLSPRRASAADVGWLNIFVVNETLSPVCVLLIFRMRLPAAAAAAAACC